MQNSVEHCVRFMQQVQSFSVCNEQKCYILFLFDEWQWKIPPFPRMIISGILLLVHSAVFRMQWNDTMSFQYQTIGLLKYTTCFLPDGCSLKHEMVFLQLYAL